MADEFDERAGWRDAADRARRRAAEAGLRVTELRERLSSLRERQEGDTEVPPSPALALEAVRTAILRRDEAARRDRAAHAAAARAHDAAATVYEQLSAVTPPEQRPEYVRRARFHRAAAEKDREATMFDGR